MNKAEAAARDDWKTYWAQRTAMPAEQKESLRSLASRVANLRIYEAHTQTAVSQARYVGVPWSYIADELGVSKQAAQQRYGRAAAEYAERKAGELAQDREDQLAMPDTNEGNSK